MVVAVDAVRRGTVELLLQKYPRPGTQKTLMGHAVRMPTILISKARRRTLKRLWLSRPVRAQLWPRRHRVCQASCLRKAIIETLGVAAKLEEHSAALAGDTKSVPKLRAVRHFAPVQLAGELMCEIGLFPERINRSTSCARPGSALRI